MLTTSSSPAWNGEFPKDWTWNGSRFLNTALPTLDTEVCHFLLQHPDGSTHSGTGAAKEWWSVTNRWGKITFSLFFTVTVYIFLMLLLIKCIQTTRWWYCGRRALTIAVRRHESISCYISNLINSLIDWFLFIRTENTTASPPLTWLLSHFGTKAWSSQTDQAALSHKNTYYGAFSWGNSRATQRERAFIQQYLN